MTRVAGRFNREILSDVAFLAGDFNVRVVQAVPGVRVFECADGPVLVTAIAVTRRFREVIRIAVTTAAG